MEGTCSPPGCSLELRGTHTAQEHQHHNDGSGILHIYNYLYSINLEALYWYWCTSTLNTIYKYNLLKLPIQLIRQMDHEKYDLYFSAKYSSVCLIFCTEALCPTFQSHCTILGWSGSLSTPKQVLRTGHLSRKGQIMMSPKVNWSPIKQGPLIWLLSSFRALSTFLRCASFSSSDLPLKVVNPKKAVRIGWATKFTLRHILALSMGALGMSWVPLLKASARYQLVTSLSMMTSSPWMRIGTFPFESGSFPNAFLQVSVKYGSLLLRETSFVSNSSSFSRAVRAVLCAKGHTLSRTIVIFLAPYMDTLQQNYQSIRKYCRYIWRIDFDPKYQFWLNDQIVYGLFFPQSATYMQIKCENG